jgi:NAD(P)H-quinone oxidoreductase subunit 5
MANYSLLALFNIDALAITVILLVGLIGTIVGLFALRYMAGDSNHHRFFCLLTCLIIAVLCMASADHLLVFLLAWGVSNFFLVKLMIHKPQWQAAANSGWLAAKSFMIGFICLTSAFIMLYLSTRQTSIQSILTVIDQSSPFSIIAVLLIALTAMTQSAIWPFHRWLISSLNSPTPVSAIMHAGLVNGGGVLLTRFAPLYFSHSGLLTLIFIWGIGTAIVGSWWKLMQNDIKRMLACSTMAQMGFMLAQCGLGLFPAAIAHLCWHGFFKANLFLNANSTRQEKRIADDYIPTIIEFIFALLIGTYGSYIFALSSHQTWLTTNTSLFLMVVVFIAATQLALILLHLHTWKNILMTLLMTTLLCASYGYSIYLIEAVLSPLQLMRPYPLNIIHCLGLALLCSMWLAMLFQKKFMQNHKLSQIKSILYVKALNASQPHTSTMTSYRYEYRYNRG